MRVLREKETSVSRILINTTCIIIIIIIIIIIRICLKNYIILINKLHI